MEGSPRLIDSVNKTRTRPMRLLLLGLPRTATESLNAALEQLGFNVFSFQAMWSNWQETIPLWTEAIEAKYHGRCKPYGRAEFDKLLGDYDVVKCPHALLFAEDLAAAYPEAKIIVSKRDYEPWRASMEKTVFALRRSVVFRLLHPLDPFRAAWWPFLRLVMDTAYGGWAEAVPGRAPYDGHHVRIEAIVQENPERMLIFSGPKDGWGPLCEFLCLPIPETAYPWKNSGGDFWEVQGHRAGERLLLRKLAQRLSACAGLGMLLYWWLKRR
ncbi:uncharacterized protein CTRU02_202762 [Colletotrichum truncatum]|uniref:Uncharacterized protein n=1 Tax=Colletotrichum truncatum TaxID=5467 RepID=A0ACC3ZL98_COLTU|nr:uncharacterized protein CTRU02_10687 [Colletotrichum truncatum]KAF6786988.1 hypothetical protein CTRU02_10687 [Colletotrichum truncatum]